MTGRERRSASSATRTERDSLGTIEVPAEALWGIHTARSVEALSHSGRRLRDLPSLVRALARVKAAATTANAEAGVVASDLARAVASAADELEDGCHGDSLVADPLAGGGAIAAHANINEVLANLANLALGGRIGGYDPVATTTVAASQSTADVVHTAVRLAVLDGADGLLASLDTLEAGLRDVADRFGSAPTLARTCLQDGLEVEARLLFDGAASAVARRRAALARSVAPLDAVVLGATVVGTGAGASPAYRSAVIDHLARRTGRPIVAAPDPASRLQHGDDLVEVGAAVALAAQVASKVARDLRLLASGPAGGFGEVGLPAVMEGSAFFVGKVNPAVPESVVHAAIEVEGRQRAAWAAADQAELHLHPYDLAAGVAVLDAIAVLDRAAGHLVRHALAELVLHRDRSSELAAGACSTKVDP